MAKCTHIAMSRRALVCALLLAIEACSPAPQETATYTNPRANEFVEFHPVIHDHVRQTRRWVQDAYRIEFQDREGDVLVFWVIHANDEKSPPTRTGGGESFAVLLDPTVGRVTKELYFQ
jgi:hypothetical protein